MQLDLPAKSPGGEVSFFKTEKQSLGKCDKVFG
jgi:hypothetical protein